MYSRLTIIGVSSLLAGFILLVQSLTQAVPLDDSAPSVSSLFPRDDYPADYPYPKKDECTSQVKTEQDKSLFYTGLGGFGLTGKQLQDFKRQAKLHIVGDSFTYPGGFVSPKNEPSNDLDKQQQYYARFADDFSEAFAEKCSGEVFLLLDYSTDPNNPPASACKTTWYRKEFDALKANSGVTKVTQVNPNDFTQKKQIWPVTSGSRLARRDDSGLCLDWDIGTAPNLNGPPTGEEDGSGAPAAAYAPGTCSFHLDEWQDCADDSKNLFAKITLYDNNKVVIGQTNVDPATNPLGDPINNSDPLHFKSKLPYDIVVTGEHENDYVQFDYDGTNSHFTSRTTDGPAKCSNGGWDPRDGPVCSSRFGNRNAHNQMDCSFPC